MIEEKRITNQSLLLWPQTVKELSLLSYLPDVVVDPPPILHNDHDHESRCVALLR